MTTEMQRRISTQDRNNAVDKLNELFALGYLDDEELSVFTEKALKTKYAADLRGLFTEFATAADKLVPEPRAPFRWPASNITGGWAIGALGLCMAVLIPLYSTFTPKGYGVSNLMQLADFGAVIVGIVIFIIGMIIVTDGWPE